MDRGGEKDDMVSLTPSEFDIYNRLAVMMEKFHSYFRRIWKRLYSACSAPDHDSPKMTDDQIVREGLFLSCRLANHHNVEESSLFPLLARRMPRFQGDDVLLKQHRQIHDGLEDFQQYLEGCRTRKDRLDRQVLKSKMDPWGDVLMLHLDQEVEMLGARYMQKYWTQEEMLEMPI
ncbi:Putative hemerythrin [Colletotrichum destructivum]|uniref:Hemerythrin n=1 Tax=Colletotrichum destructivum TaxID=34406 RepID=A0AAX4ICT5_9PEZI|nr:Putative hemerythrin [Colletotrichum destructivum]